MAQNENTRPYAPIFHEAWRQSYGGAFIPGFARDEDMSKQPGKKIPGGKSQNNFRGGTRSEYLANYALSRFCFVYQVPRQEDVGVDFLCTLGHVKSDKLVYPENSFYVQVKSDKEDFHINANSIEWIVNHMDLPLYICVAEKKKNTISMYSLSILWELLFSTHNISGITFIFDKRFDYPIYELQPDDVREYDDIAYKVYVGDPIFTQTLSDLENDTSSTAYMILKKWVEHDSINMLNKKLGGLHSSHIEKWEANTLPTGSRGYRYYHDKDHTSAESLISGPLTALAFAYKSRMHRLNEKLSDDEKLELAKKINHIKEFIRLIGDIPNMVFLDDFLNKVDNLLPGMPIDEKPTPEET